MSFQGHLKLIENENFHQKLITILEICEFLLSTLFTVIKKQTITRKNIKKSLKKILQVDS